MEWRSILEGAAMINIAPNQTLRQAIYRYRAAWMSYLADSIDDDATPPLWQPSYRVLVDWTGPATCRDEAREALELAIENYHVGDTPLIPSMIRAALAYLENGERP